MGWLYRGKFIAKKAQSFNVFNKREALIPCVPLTFIFFVQCDSQIWLYRTVYLQVGICLSKFKKLNTSTADHQIRGSWYSASQIHTYGENHKISANEKRVCQKNEVWCTQQLCART